MQNTCRRARRRARQHLIAIIGDLQATTAVGKEAALKMPGSQDTARQRPTIE
jgi:hypothetical protein